MKLTPQEITTNQRYRLIRSVCYNEIADFVISLLKLSNPIIALLVVFTLLSLGLAVSVRINIGQYWSAGTLLPYTLAGMVAVPLLLIPVHEGLHILILFILGGRDIRMGADLSNFLFYVTAHRHVVKPISFIIIALFPFITVSLTTLTGIAYLPWEWKWVLSLSLLAHTTMCAGDFAMVAFYYDNRKKRILTWDDADEKIAYFYEDTEA